MINQEGNKSGGKEQKVQRMIVKKMFSDQENNLNKN